MTISYNLLRRAVLFLSIILCACTLQAQQVTVKGQVTNATDGEPLEGATCQAPEVGAGAFSEEDGSFSFTVAKADSLVLRFAYVGFRDTTIKVAIPASNSVEVNISLISTDIQIKETVITAGRHEQDLAKVPASMELISPKKVDFQATNDIEDALQQGSGVDIIDGQPNIRGSSGYAYGVGSRVMIMLDGLPLLSADASFAQFDLIPTDNIEQIEIMKGASSVLYGSSALGGVINVITADAPKDPLTSVRVRGTVFGAPSNPALDWDGDKGAKEAALNIFHSRRLGGKHDLTLLADVWKETGYRKDTDAENARFMAMTRFRPEKIPGLTYGINASARFDSSSTMLFWDSYLPSDSIVPFGSEASDTVYASDGAYAGVGTRRRQLNSRFTIDPFVKYLTPKNNLHTYRGRIMRTINTNDTQQSNRNTVYYNDYQYLTSFWDRRVSWVMGATATYNQVRGDSLYDGKHYSMNMAAYTQFDVAVTEKLQATLGGRFDHFNIDGEKNEMSPIFRVGANYTLQEGTNIRVSFGQAFRSPSIAERFTSTNAGGLVIVPNPELQVEKGYSAEIGLRQGFLGGTKERGVRGFVDVAAFTMRFNNMIEFGIRPPDSLIFPPPTPEFQARNISDARISGLEATLMLEAHYDKWYFSLNGGVTYLIPRNLNPAPDSAQVDILNTIGPQESPTTFDAFLEYFSMTLPDDHPDKKWDNPAYLKYRSTWTNRFSATVGYGRFGLTGNYRYKSQIQSIDQFLFVAIPGSADFVKAHQNGQTIVDAILSVDIMANMFLSLNIDNVFNEEYAILPGIIGKQRNYTVQWKYVF